MIRDDAWIISDTHFGHAKIIEYAGRPFKSVPEMDEIIIENWNKRVDKKDQVVFLGDFAFANAEITKIYRKRLNGEIIMIMGNHDRHRSISWWQNHGFIVFPYPIVYKNNFILSHEPVDWITGKYPLLNIHGHEHEKTAYNISNHHYNVSVEAAHYLPLRLHDVIQEGRNRSDGFVEKESL